MYYTRLHICMIVWNAFLIIYPYKLHMKKTSLLVAWIILLKIGTLFIVRKIILCNFCLKLYQFQALLWYLIASFLSMNADAHKRYGGMGTVLVIKVWEWCKDCSCQFLSDWSVTAIHFRTCVTNSACVHVQVSAESASQFGELVADPVTNELLHYTEKPETFVSIHLQNHVTSC